MTGKYDTDWAGGRGRGLASQAAEEHLTDAKT
jgi:hypothetical protein